MSYSDGNRVIKAYRAVPVAPAEPAGFRPGGLPVAPAPPEPGLLTAEEQEVLEAPTAPATPVARPGQAEGLLAAVTLEEARRRAEALETRARLLLAEAEEAAQARQAEAAQAQEVLLEQARAEVEALRSQARAQGFAEGREAGYRDGLAAGREEAQGLVRVARQEAEAALDRARQEAQEYRRSAAAERDELVTSLEPQLVRLAVAIARQVLRAEISLRPEAVVPMVAAALSRLKGDAQPRLRVHPDDAARLDGRRQELRSAWPGAGDVELVPDPGLAPGDFVLHSDQGTVDGRLEAQFAEVASALEAGVSGGEDS